MSNPPRRPSRTAVVTAVARALYRDVGGPVILDDGLALPLAGEDGLALAERFRAELPWSHVLAFSRWMCIRSRFTEDLIERAIGRGAGQYVILGAGLDSFAYRRGDLMGHLRVYEVDHPASQSWKQDRLRDLGIGVPDTLVFVPVDFERQTLREGLVSAGFDFARPAVFSWIGVTMYLTIGAIEATLGTIAQCAAGSQLALTYNQPHHVLDHSALQVTSSFEPIAKQFGEPFVSLFTRDEIERLLRRHSFDDITHFGPQEARVAWFGGASDVAIAGAQRLIAATVAADRV